MHKKIGNKISKTKASAILAFGFGIFAIIFYLGIINDPNKAGILFCGLLALTFGFYSVIRSKLKRRNFIWSLLGIIGIWGGIISILSFL